MADINIPDNGKGPIAFTNWVVMPESGTILPERRVGRDYRHILIDLRESRLADPDEVRGSRRHNRERARRGR